MAKKRVKTQAESSAEIPVVDARPVDSEPVYAFPRSVPCPRCKVSNTLATSTRGSIQLRKCQQPICQNTFKVSGTAI